MYREFFGLEDKPFAITPNPRFIFLSKNHKEVFAHLLYGIRHHCGFIEVCGEVGTGKTTVLRTLLSQLEDDAYRLAFIFNPSLSAPELLRSINREFGIACEGSDNDALICSLNAFLLRENAEGRTVVLVIDEAQNLEPAVLEQIRLLSNLETETDKLIQIILVGQPELEQVLAQSRLRQLSQRITVRYHLRPMDFEDTCAYIEHRLEVAGAKGPIFTPAAVKKTYRYSGGLPRLINVLCDRALLAGYAEDAREISVAMVATAIRELHRQASSAAGARRWWPVLLGVCLGLVAIFGFLTVAPRLRPAAPAVSAAPNSSPSTADADRTDPEAVRRQLVGLDENTAAVAACNVLIGLWDAEPLAAGTRLAIPGGLPAPVTERGLQLTPFQGSLDELIHLDVPALIELSLPDGLGRRCLSLEHVAGGRGRIAPALEHGSWLDLAVLRRFWSGRAYFFWRNDLDIPFLAVAGASGEGVARLQNLLREAGEYQGIANGVYDRDTIAAVRNFQARRGIAQDGQVGPQTLMLLYQEAGSMPMPKLSGLPRGGGA